MNNKINNPEEYPNGEKYVVNYLLKNKEKGLLFATHGTNKGVKALRPKMQNDTAIYSLNSGYFRSDEFNKRDSGGKTVLFAGCSVMYGEGHDLETSFAYILYEHLSKKEKLSGFFNIGIGGATGFQCITSIFDYIDIYGNPDSIVLLLPPLERDMAYFLSYGKGFWETQYRDSRDQKDAEEDYKRHVVLFNHIYKMLYLYCKTNNITLISSHWGEYKGKAVNIFKNYQYTFEQMLEILYPDTHKRLNYEMMHDDIYNYIQLNKNMENLLEAKDGQHQGIAWNHAVAKQIIEMFKL